MSKLKRFLKEMTLQCRRNVRDPRFATGQDRKNGAFQP